MVEKIFLRKRRIDFLQTHNVILNLFLVLVGMLGQLPTQKKGNLWDHCRFI